MTSYKERLKKLIEIIREKPDWVAGHSTIDFGGTKVGYYDTDDKEDFFEVKFDGISLTNQFNGPRIEWEKWEQYDQFCLDAWITKLEKIMAQKTLVLDGKKYLLTEIEGGDKSEG